MNEVQLVGTILVVNLNNRQLIIADDVDLTEACEIMLDLAKIEGKPFAAGVHRKLSVRRQARSTR